MRTALDNYEIGKQKEVDINNLPFVDRSVTRFVCPECKEPVHMVVRMDGTKYFAHNSKKKAIVKECDRRVEASIVKSIYERMGMPLYLRNDNNDFKLCLGFKALPLKIIRDCELLNSYIEICGIDNTPQKFYINDYNFSDSFVTYKTIEYLSKYQEPNVSFSDKYTRDKIAPYWSDYIDNIDMINGALFINGSKGGRMIRNGECISTFTNYYWVTPNYRLTSSFNEMKTQELGKIKLKNKIFYVFQVSFDITTEHHNRYTNLYNYILEKLKLFLLEKNSTFYPIWPPSIQCEDGYRFSKDGSVIYTIETNNDNPTVYSYVGSATFPSQTFPKKVGNGYYDSMLINQYGTLITVDRKNVSNAVTIKTEMITQKFDYSIIENDTGLFQEEINKLEDIFLYVNETVDAYLIDKYLRISKQTFTKGEIVFKNNKSIKTVCLLYNDTIIKIFNIINYKSEESEDFKISDQVLYNFVKKCRYDKKVLINNNYIREVDYIINNYPLCRRIFLNYKNKNEIPITILLRIRGVINE